MLGPQPTLKQKCSKHPDNIAIFEDKEANKLICEFCYAEIEEKIKKETKDEGKEGGNKSSTKLNEII